MTESPPTGAGEAGATAARVRAIYAERCATFAALRDRAAARSTRLSHARLACFLALLAAGVWAEAAPGALRLLLVLALLAAFIVLVVLHARRKREERWWQAMTAVNEDGPRRLDRKWGELSVAPLPASAAAPAFAADLDLYGTRALRQLLGPTITPAGERVLAEWLLGTRRDPPVADRQAAVRALAAEHDLRDALAAHARLTDVPDPDGIARFLAWAETPPPAAPPHALLRWAVPVATALAVLLWSQAVLPGSIVLVPIAIAAALTFGPTGRRVRAEMRRAFGREEIFRLFPELIAQIERSAADAPLLLQLREGLAADGLPATHWMRRLGRLAHLAELRSSGQLWLPVQLATLWDFHVLARMRTWRATAGGNVRAWLEILGTEEALAALATLAHDHPDWAWPVVAAGEPAFDARMCGHPMLPERERVDNDVTVGPAGRFLLVTGSNMSGKSTLLRAIGTNAVLATAGAPVCARALRMPDVDLRTAIHVQDSLADGVSYFMAQLQRVKEIVTAADRAHASQERVVLYLFDEILQGTNTAERRIAATRVIRHLVAAGAIGAVTTHDLELADEPAIRDAAVTVHFRETVHSDTRPPRLSFDHILRPGVATSTNALRLMAIVGLES